MTGGKTLDQICRFDGQNCFIEVMNGMFNPLKAGKFGKVLLNFCTYGQDNKQTNKIPIYVDLPKFLLLCEDLIAGHLDNAAYRARQNNKQNDTLWNDTSGTSATILQRQGQARPDGMSESRLIDIYPSRDVGKFLLVAKRGPGEEQGKGIIVPKLDYKNPNSYEKISVRVTSEELRSMAVLVKMNYQAFLTRKWAEGYFDIERTTTPAQSQPQPNNQRPQNANHGYGNTQVGNYQQNQNQVQTNNPNNGYQPQGNYQQVPNQGQANYPSNGYQQQGYQQQMPNQGQSNYPSNGYQQQGYQQQMPNQGQANYSNNGYQQQGNYQQMPNQQNNGYAQSNRQSGNVTSFASKVQQRGGQVPQEQTSQSHNMPNLQPANSNYNANQQNNGYPNNQNQRINMAQVINDEEDFPFPNVANQ